MSNSDISFSHSNYKSPYSPDALNYSSSGKFSELIRVGIEAVGYYRDLERWSYSDVFSPFWRLYYNPQKGKSLELAGASYPLLPDTIMLVPPQVFFSCHSEEITDHFWIHFSLPVEWRARYDSPIDIPLEKHHEGLLNILSEYDYTDPTESDLTGAYTMANALVYLAIASVKVPETSQVPQVLEKALREIESTRGAIPRLSEFSAQLHTSERNLRRLFTRHLGINPNAYILGVRIRHATELLRDDKLSIEQIAAKTGFADRYHFSKSFQRQLELTPVQYRKTFAAL